MRLGDAIKPVAYDATLTVLPDNPGFEGRIHIDIDIARAQDFFWLNATDLDVKRATLTVGRKTIDATVVPGGEDFVGLKFPAVLPKGRARLAIDYSGTFSDNDTRGLFKQKVGDEWYVFSQFEARHARRAFPCFDEPHWKTPWTVSLIVKQEHVAVSNMPAVSETEAGQGMKQIRFASSPPLPSYLVAVGIGPFDVVDGGVAGKNKVPLRYLTPKGQAAEARYAKEVTPKLLDLLEDYFGRPYPYAKLDSLAIPVTVNFGAMENAGLITYRSSFLLASAAREDERFKKRYAAIAAHEIAHQWFGNLVTMRWWNDLWLNESFATWMARKTVEKFNPEWDAHERRDEERHHAISIDRLASTRQIRQPINTHDDLANAFDGITYDKGGAVLNMFESWLGEAGFREGVRRYIDRHEWRNATAEDFFAALAKSEPRLAKGFASFVEQPGVPLVDMSLDCTSKPTLQLTQKRFQPGAAPGAVRQQNWAMPVCVRYDGQTSDEPVCTFMSQRKASLRLPNVSSCPAWILPNPGGAGYFLSGLDEALIKPLANNRLKPVEAVSLMSDLSALASAGKFPIDRLMEVSANYAADSRPELVRAAADALRALHPAMLDGDTGKARLAGWISNRFAPRATEIGWLPRNQDSEELRNLRRVLLPLVAEIGANDKLRSEARELAINWLKGKQVAELGAMTRPVLRSAAYSGDAALFDAFVSVLRQSKDFGIRNDIYNALGAFTEPALREKAFQLVLDEELDPREAVSILWTAGFLPENAPAVLAFVRDNYETLLKRLPEDSHGSITRWGAGLCSAEDRNAFVEFHRERAPRHQGGARNLALDTEAIDICLANRNAQQERLQRFLARQD